MEGELVNIILLLAFGALIIAMILTLTRLIRGPEAGDRIVALDLVASIAMGFILLYAVSAGKALFFDVAIVISLISFIGTVAVSIYLKQK
jgi:multicomponent Na+:H+ antiporter subunit F